METKLLLKVLMELVVAAACLYVGGRAIIKRKLHSRRRTIYGAKAVFGGAIGVVIGLAILVIAIIDALKTM
ncbi:MAG: hypothetical protein PHI58_00600 [Candidatus Omnitrophica bacterium]|nr:hypothetical protein [Candidatus Omnitrophota bacterium]